VGALLDISTSIYGISIMFSSTITGEGENGFSTLGSGNSNIKGLLLC